MLIESPQYPRGLWLHLVDEAGAALAGLQVEYQGQPDSLVAIRCVDPTRGVQETLVWTRPGGDSLRLTLRSKVTTDLPAGVAPIDWRIDPTAESLLEPVEEIRLIGWEEVSAFLQAHWQGQTGRVAVQIKSSTTLTTSAVEVEHPETIETLVAHLQQTHRPADTSLGESTALYVQVLRGGLASLQEGVILYLPLFADTYLERVVWEALDRPQGRLTSEDVASLSILLVANRGIHSLVGIKHITDLQRLGLSSNHIADLTPLKQSTNLEILDLTNNQIVDLTPLTPLTNLKSLSLHNNQIVDLTPLKQLTNLEGLGLSSNHIVNLIPLKKLTNLKRLVLFDNQIVDLTPLTPLTNLKSLSLAYNEIEDLTPLIANPGLSKGDIVYLTDNPLSDQARNKHIPALKARGVTVHY